MSNQHTKSASDANSEEISVFHLSRDCLRAGPAPFIPHTNAVVILFCERFENLSEASSSLQAAGFTPELLSLFTPFSLAVIPKFPRQPSQEPKRVCPSLQLLSDLLKSYESGEPCRYRARELSLMNRCGFQTPKDCMSAVLSWALLYYSCEALRTQRFFALLGFDHRPAVLRSIRERIIKRAKSRDETFPSEASKETISRLCWLEATSSGFRAEISPLTLHYLRSVAAGTGSENFFERLLNENICLTEDLFRTRPYTCAGQSIAFLKDFCTEFAKEYKIPEDVLKLAPNQRFKSRKKGCLRCMYGQPLPSHIPGIKTIYVFMSASIFTSQVVIKKYALKENEAALFVIFVLMHLPYFDAQASERIPKQSRLWPKLSRENGAAVLFHPASFVMFLKAAIRHEGPGDYLDWAIDHFPEDLSPYTMDQLIGKLAGSPLGPLAKCAQSFIRKHLAKA